jgi:hypothetical protein
MWGRYPHHWYPPPPHTVTTTTTTGVTTTTTIATTTTTTTAATATVTTTTTNNSSSSSSSNNNNNTVNTEICVYWCTSRWIPSEKTFLDRCLIRWLLMSFNLHLSFLFFLEGAELREMAWWLLRCKGAHVAKSGQHGRRYFLATWYSCQHVGIVSFDDGMETPVAFDRSSACGWRCEGPWIQGAAPCLSRFCTQNVRILLCYIYSIHSNMTVVLHSLWLTRVTNRTTWSAMFANSAINIFHLNSTHTYMNIKSIFCILKSLVHDSGCTLVSAEYGYPKRSPIING